MAMCSIDGNSDMYGLGIRLGFYLQWIGSIIASWLAPSEVPAIRFGINVFVAATFLALVILTGRDVQSLEVVETYIILLLTFGSYAYLVPLFAWRVLTWGNPCWDPSRWPIVRQSAVESVLRTLLLSGVSSFQLWFWIARISDLNSQDCREYGFLFSRVRLNAQWFRIVNIVLHSLVLLICLDLLCVKLLIRLEWIREREFHEEIRYVRPDQGELDRTLTPHLRTPSERRKRNLQNLGSTINFLVAVIVIAATELTIHWNKIHAVNAISSAGQTIPFVIGIAIMVRIVYVWLHTEKPKEGGTEQTHTPTRADDLPMSYGMPTSVGDLPLQFAAPPRT